MERGDAVLDRIYSVLQQESTESLTSLTSEYYTLIPHSHGRSKPPVISSMDMYKAKQELSQLMKDMLEVSSGEGKASILVEDDVDAKYEALAATIELVDKSSTEYNNLMAHIGEHRNHSDHKNFGDNGDGFDATKKRSPVQNDVEKRTVNVFKITRGNEEKRFNGKIGNEHHLFHASRFANWVGILSRGLMQPDAVTALGIARTDFGWCKLVLFVGCLLLFCAHSILSSFSGLWHLLGC